MPQKSNLRSFRYSDEVAAILEKQPGKSFNDKFEQLVLRCFYELPAIERRKTELEAQIQQRRDELRKMARQTERIHQMMQTLKTAEHYMAIVARTAEQIAENTK